MYHVHLHLAVCCVCNCRCSNYIVYIYFIQVDPLSSLKLFVPQCLSSIETILEGKFHCDLSVIVMYMSYVVASFYVHCILK